MTLLNVKLVKVYYVGLATLVPLDASMAATESLCKFMEIYHCKR